MRERRVAFTAEAECDLNDLYDWLADRATPAVALGYLDRVESFCKALSIGSERGHRRDDIRPGLRILGFERRLTVAFLVTEDQVTVLRVFGAGRDWEKGV